MGKKIAGFFLKAILPLGVGVYLFWHFFSSMTIQAKKIFYQTLGEVDYGWIILSLILALASYISRAYRWKFALEPLGYNTKNLNRFHAVMIGYLVNLTLPRAGEASRALVLYRADGVPFAKGFGTIISERIVDMFFLVIITCSALFLGFDDFEKIKLIIQANFISDESGSTNYLLYMLIAAMSIGLGLMLIRKVRIKVGLIIQDLFSSTVSIVKTKNPRAYILHSLFIWVCFLVMFILPFYALESTKDLPISCMLLAFVAGSIGISLTNGGIGSFPLLVGIVVGYYLSGLPDERAIAIGNALGMLIWVSQTVLLVLIGLISWILVPKTPPSDEQI